MYLARYVRSNVKGSFTLIHIRNVALPPIYRILYFLGLLPRKGGKSPVWPSEDIHHIRVTSVGFG